MALNMKHILASHQFDFETIEYIYRLTNCIRQFDKSKEGLLYLRSLLSHRRAMLYFTQTSTRTFLSFHSACHVLGLQVCEIRDPSTSSEVKGESVEDSIRTFSSYVDLIIMRSPVAGLCDRMAKLFDQTPRPVPIINAGSGPDEHPTQAVLDVYTLMRCFHGCLENKTICMVGDLKHGRTIRSLAKTLCLFKGIKIIFTSPEEYKIQNDLRQHLKQQKSLKFEETTDFNSSIAAADVIYMTRVQDEWAHIDTASQDDSPASSDATSSSSARGAASGASASPQASPRMRSKSAGIENYYLGPQHLSMIKKECIIMHPLPRRKELAPEIDNDPRATYWRQERNGMWTRAALITMLLGVNDKICLPSL